MALIHSWKEGESRTVHITFLVAIYKSLSSYKIRVRVSRHIIGADVADDEQWLSKYFTLCKSFLL